VFTLDEYMDWYAVKFGEFSYFTDVAGFNMPSYVLSKFYGGEFDTLTKKEKKILEIFKDMKEPYYIIATSSMSSEQEDDIIHEVSHGLYHVNKEYQKTVKKILKGQDLTKIYVWLKVKGYHRAHFLDEAHAILIESAATFKRCGESAADYRKIRKQLRDNYNKHFVHLNSKIKKAKL
jgi:hypothetical protein